MTAAAQLDNIRRQRAEAIRTAAGSARRVLAMIEGIVAGSPCPMERRAVRSRAIRRTLLAIIKAPDPFARPVIVPPAVTVTPPVVEPRVPRRVVTEPIQKGAP